MLSKVHIVKAMVFPVVVYKCMSWTIKKAKHQRIKAIELGIGEDSWESGIKPVNPKGNQSWIFIGRTNVEADVSTLWPRDTKSWLIRKDPDARHDWGQEEKWAVEDEMVGWHHWLNGHEFKQTLGEGERRVAWCAIVHRVAKSPIWCSNWTATI